MLACPPAELLRRLGSDSLSPADFAAIEAHVSGCERCQSDLERMAGESATPTALAVAPWPPGPVAPAIPGFEIERELGRGGMAIVYRAWQPSAGRHVAIKVVGGGPGVGDRQRARWLREARAMGKVAHPNVLPLYQVDEHDGWLYLVLELMPGGSLKDHADGPLPPKAAARLVESAAGALAAVHAEGVLHLDIKPSNILLDAGPELGWDRPTPKLADFGIAREPGDAEGAASSTQMAGTPSYMAPEQVAGPRGAIGEPADVFALGATLYALLTGRPPFQAATPLETIDLLRSREPAPPRTLVPGLPRDLETITLRCLEKDPARRYPSAGALADDLRRWREGFPIRARPASTAERAARWCRRHPGLAGMWATLAAVVAASILGLYALYRQTVAERDRANLALQRSRESESAASGSVAALADILDQTINSPHAELQQRMERSSRAIIDLTARLRKASGLPTEDVLSIIKLQRKLVPFLNRTNRTEQSRALLEACAGLLRSRRDGSPEVEWEYAMVLLSLGIVDHWEGNYAAALARFREVDSALIPILGRIDVLEPAYGTFVYRNGLGFVGTYLRGDPELRRRLNEENLRLFEAIAAHMPDDPGVGFVIAVSRDEIAPDASTRAGVWAALDRSADAQKSRWNQEIMIGEWAGRRILEEVQGAGPPGRSRTPEEFASDVLAAMDARIRTHRIGPADARELAVGIGSVAGVELTAARRAKRMEEARYRSDWLLVYARKLVAREPRSAAPYLVLGRAYEHRQKLQWASGQPDAAAIERDLRASLAAVWTALELDPGWEVARLALVGAQEKYIGFVVRPDVISP